MHRFTRTLLVGIAFCLLAVAGCSSIGPRTVANDSFNYTDVLADSWKQRMLINMVRLRYGDTPIFLEVASVINQYSLETGVNVSGQIARTGAGDIFVGMGGHGTYTDRPTITYIPLGGERFARSLMRPLPLSAVMGMIEVGYPVDTVLQICVESINGIRNRYEGVLREQPASAEFYPLLDRLRRIQDSGAIALRVQRNAEKDITILSLRGTVDAAVAEDSLQVRKLLGLDPATEEFGVVYASRSGNDRELAVLTRSILQIISNLAASIEVPDAHLARKLVRQITPEVTAAGTAVSPLIRIRSSPSKPDNAFVAVPYQSSWFWIDNSDPKSKGLFSFLMFLFSLTEVSGKEGAPIVTISAGG